MRQLRADRDPARHELRGYGTGAEHPYRYQARATDAAGNLSGYSNVASATTSTPAAATLTTLSPSSAVAGGPAFTLTVNGTGFVNGATVRWNGQARTTTFVSSTQLGPRSQRAISASPARGRSRS